MINEFKAFINKGNFLDLAVAVIMAAAFGLVVASFTNDILMQIIAAIFGQPDFSGLYFNLGNGVIKYGAFLNTIINFLIVAFVMFLVIKAYNNMRKPHGRRDQQQRVPILPLHHSCRRDPMPQLHLGTDQDGLAPKRVTNDIGRMCVVRPPRRLPFVTAPITIAEKRLTIALTRRANLVQLLLCAGKGARKSHEEP